MPRYRLIIAYDGTDFCGWQKQEPPAGTEVRADKVLEGQGSGDGGQGTGEARIVLRTVQEVVERAVRSVVREPVVLLGASRTDSGVHARGQVAAFTCGGDEGAPPGLDTGWPLSRGTDPLRRAINARLPEDVLVLGADAVRGTFDPISDCVAKGYSYTLHLSDDRPVFERRFVHHVRGGGLDVAAMRSAAGRIVGEHDFAAFAKAGHGRESTVRTVFECRVEEAGPERVAIHVSGNGFLYNMVRIIAGTLVEVGRGRLTADDVGAAIESQDRRRAGPTLPPHGLCLEWVRYEEAPGASQASAREAAS